MIFLYLDDINLFHKHVKPEKNEQRFNFQLNKKTINKNNSMIYTNKNWIIPNITRREGLTNDHFCLIKNEINKNFDYHYKNNKLMVVNRKMF